MKTCLLCDHEEKSNLKEIIPYICAKCLTELMTSDKENINARYIDAMESGKARVAYALYTFVPHATREKYPLDTATLKKSLDL